MANESISVVEKNYKPPKQGERRIYKLLDIGIDPDTKGFRCPNTRKISNKFLVNDGGTVKSYVFVKHQDPSTRSDSVPDNQKGKIVFAAASGGIISIHGDRPDMFELDKALYFHQQNITNKGESWHVHPRGGYVFERVDKAKKATQNVETIERRINAEQLIYTFDAKDISDLYEVIFKSNSEGLTEDEIRGELYDYVQNDDNAKALLILKDEKALKIKKIIRTKGNELICTKLPRKTIDQSLMMYLVTDEGAEVLKTLKDLTEAKAN
jgi:hypothetical protein